MYIHTNKKELPTNQKGKSGTDFKIFTLVWAIPISVKVIAVLVEIFKQVTEVVFSINKLFQRPDNVYSNAV